MSEGKRPETAIACAHCGAEDQPLGQFGSATKCRDINACIRRYTDKEAQRLETAKKDACDELTAEAQKLGMYPEPDAQGVVTYVRDPYEAAHDRYDWTMGKRYPDERGTTWAELDEDERAAWRYAFETYAELEKTMAAVGTQGQRRERAPNRLCQSCDNSPASEWCSDCIVSDYQAACGCTKCVVTDELAALRKVAEAARQALFGLALGETDRDREHNAPLYDALSNALEAWKRIGQGMPAQGRCVAMKAPLIDVLDARKFVARINDYRTPELAAQVLAREFVRIRNEMIEECASICDRERRACEHHLETVQQIGHKGTQHKAGAQIAGDCATLIRRLTLLPPLPIAEDRSLEQRIADGDEPCPRCHGVGWVYAPGEGTADCPCSKQAKEGT